MASYTNGKKDTFASRSLGDQRRYAVRTESADGFIYTASNGQVTILGATVEDENVIIPAELEGLPVTVIGNGAFSNRKMRTITIPESVTAIADGVFCECDELTEIRVDVENPYYQGMDGLLFIVV